MSRILVTGGTGFVGSRTICALNSAGHEARIFDLASASRQPGAPASADIVTGDITDGQAVMEAARGCNGIVHLAGLMTVDCARDPVRATSVNLIGSLNVLQAAAALGLPVAYLSTAGVFGPSDALHPHPSTIYGMSKLAVEGAARSFHLDHGVASLGLRPYIVYGTGISSGIAAGPSIALAASVRREPSTIRFSGRVGFVHVDDVARLLAAAMTVRLEGATVLTMAGDTADMSDFVGELARQTGWHDVAIEGPPLRIPPELASDTIPAIFGPQPVTTISEGIASSLTELRTFSHAS